MSSVDRSRNSAFYPNTINHNAPVRIVITIWMRSADLLAKTATLYHGRRTSIDAVMMTARPAPVKPVELCGQLAVGQALAHPALCHVGHLVSSSRRTLILATRKFIHVALQMLFTHVVTGANVSTLHQRPA